MQITEIWRPIVGFAELYAVSNLGRVKSLSKKKHTPYGTTYLAKEKIMKPSLMTNGYWIVTLSRNGKQAKKLVHVLVAEAFIENPMGYGFVNHDDGNKSNNRASNLDWCTRSQNMQHAYANGLISRQRARKNKVL